MLYTRDWSYFCLDDFRFDAWNCFKTSFENTPRKIQLFIIINFVCLFNTFPHTSNLKIQWKICSWKHCGKRRNSSFWVISPFATMISNVVCSICLKTCLHFVKGYVILYHDTSIISVVNTSFLQIFFKNKWRWIMMSSQVNCLLFPTYRHFLTPLQQMTFETIVAKE